MCKNSFIHIQNIYRIRKFINHTALEQIIHAFITSRLDFCNALLCGVPSTVLSRLQRVQNVCARILTNHPRHEHITPVIKALHWLPVAYRIKYKVLMLVYKSLHEMAPRYLQDMIQQYSTRRNLRSSSQALVTVPFTRSAMAKNCAFSIAGPAMWNDLPDNIRSSTSLDIFKAKLKTYLFLKCFHDV